MEPLVLGDAPDEFPRLYGLRETQQTVPYRRFRVAYGDHRSSARDDAHRRDLLEPAHHGQTRPRM